MTWIVRAICLVLAVYLLAYVRSGTEIYMHAAESAAALALIYIALGGTAFRVWALYVGGFILFAQLRGYADEIGTPVQYEYAVFLEKAVFLGQIPSIWLQDRLYTFAHLGPLEFYTMAVYLSYFFFPHILAIALWRWDRPRFKTYVFAFMGTMYIGLLTSALLPTAPPWLAGQEGHIPHVFQVVPDIAGEVTPGTYDNAYEVAGANPVAAMPSLHSAVPFLMAIALWKYRWLRPLGAAYAVSMVFSVVYLGEHYAVDGFAGWGVAGASWVGVTKYLKRRESSRMVNATVPADRPRVTETGPQVTAGDAAVNNGLSVPVACNDIEDATILAIETQVRTDTSEGGGTLKRPQPKTQPTGQQTSEN